MKYIIDIPSKADFVTAYYMEDGLPVMYKSDRIDDLELYTEPDRKAIEDEVWELARRIICPSDCCEDSIFAHTKEIFNKEGWEIRGIFNDLSYQEAKSKYEAWLKQKDKIHVGDEVIFEMAFGNGLDNTMKAVAIDQAATGEEWCILTENGCIETHDEEDLYKTGRHFDEVGQMLEKMRGGEG